jgi:hypothetical protein
VFMSPRTRVSIGDGSSEAARLAHEILSYTAWRLRTQAASTFQQLAHSNLIHK